MSVMSLVSKGHKTAMDSGKVISTTTKTAKQP